MTITHVFFDIGGVLGTGGWDTDQRALAAGAFELDLAEFEQRHREVVGMLEEGRMTLDEYLDLTVLYRPRPFVREEFKAFMVAQSVPYTDTIGIARALGQTRRYRLMTINNESAELNVHRIATFELRDIFSMFFSSCWLGVMKPARRIYQLALQMSQADPARAVFIDDREQNLAPARALGMTAILYTNPDALVTDLAAVGIDSGFRRSA